VDEEMAEGGQVGDSKGGGPRKSGWAGEGEGEGEGVGGWLALLICKTAKLRTLCLPALLFVLHILHRLLFLRAQPLALSPPPPVPPSLSLALTRYRDSATLLLARARASVPRP